MAQKLTDAGVKALELPEKGSRITYDGEVKGFGCRVTAAGARAFILNYRTKAGRERRITIGSWPDWKTTAAREEAKGLKRRVDVGEDPMGEAHAERAAKSMDDLCDRFVEEHLPKKRAATSAEYAGMIRRDIRPAFKHMKVDAVGYSDIEGLHRRITKDGRGYQANRVLAVLSKMFSLAIRWGWRPDNPVIGIERNPEEKRKRYLSGSELARLTAALAMAEDQQAANIVRMLLLTGARKGEVLGAEWSQFDLAAGVWTKPSALTKQKTEHRVPISAPAIQLLKDIRAANPRGKHVFPGRNDGQGARTEIRNAWASLCAASGIVEAQQKDGKTIMVPSARIHDLRHTYASVLASAGLSLPVIGALLGHTQPATTARYAHLFDDPLRAATEHVGAIVMPGKKPTIAKGAD